MKKLLLLLFLIPNLVIAENAIYCADELATGILKDYEKGRDVWQTTNFKLARHTIKFNDDYTKLDGLSFWPMSCSNPYKALEEQSLSDSDYIACVHLRGSHETFTYDKRTKRYLYSNTKVNGYVGNDNGYANSLRAGTCEAF